MLLSDAFWEPLCLKMRSTGGWESLQGSHKISSSSSSWREDSWGPLRRLSMMTVILCLLPLPSDTQWWSVANMHDPLVTRTSRSSPPDSVGLVSGLDSNDLLQDLVRWSGGVQSGHVSKQQTIWDCGNSIFYVNVKANRRLRYQLLRISSNHNINTR